MKSLFKDLGKVLNREEQQKVNGGRAYCGPDDVCCVSGVFGTFCDPDLGICNPRFNTSCIIR